MSLPQKFPKKPPDFIVEHVYKYIYFSYSARPGERHSVRGCAAVLAGARRADVLFRSRRCRAAAASCRRALRACLLPGLSLHYFLTNVRMSEIY